MLREAVGHTGRSLGFQEPGFSLGSDIGLQSGWKPLLLPSALVRPFVNETWTPDRPCSPLQDREGITFDFGNLKGSFLGTGWWPWCSLPWSPARGTHHPLLNWAGVRHTVPADGLCEDVSVIYLVNKATGSFYTLPGAQEVHVHTGSLGVLGAWRPETRSRTWSRRLQPFSF